MDRARERESAGEDEEGRRGVPTTKNAVPASGRRGDGAGGRGRRRRAQPGLRRARDRGHEARA
ncbi:hypothetical protein CRG98_048879, partial [Punica granatum]